MALSGKKFTGKIVKGLDSTGRARYLVHVPELMPHQAETNGIWCMNSINGSRIGGSTRGMTGSYKPLYEGQMVTIEMNTDDVNSARIVEVIADDKENKTPSFKAICSGVTGKVEKIATGIDIEDKTKFKMPALISNFLKELQAAAQAALAAVQTALAEAQKALNEAIAKVNAAIKEVEKQATEAAQKALSSAKAEMASATSTVSKYASDAASKLTESNQSNVNVALDNYKTVRMDAADAKSTYESKVSDFDNARALYNESNGTAISSAEVDVKEALAQAAADSYKEKANEVTDAANKVKEAQAVSSTSASAIPSMITDASGKSISTGIKSIFDSDSALKKFTELENKAKNIKIDEKYLKYAQDEFTKSNSNESTLGKPWNSETIKTNAYSYQLGRALTDEEKQLAKIKFGGKSSSDYITELKQTWEKQNIKTLQNNAVDGNNSTTKEEGKPSAQTNPKDRDEETIVTMTPDKTGIAINENSSDNSNSLLIVHKGKQSAIKICDDGIYISTNLSLHERIVVNNDIQIDGSSSITVNGGNYDIYVNGNANIETTGKFNAYSHGDMNLRSDANINISSTNGNVNIGAAQQLNVFSKDVVNIKANSDARFSCIGQMSLKSSGIMALDGSPTKINCHVTIPPDNADGAIKATPMKRAVCKV